MSLVHLIRENKLFEAKKHAIESLDREKEALIVEYKKWLSANILTEGRFKIVRVRIRKGKIQRRKKVSNIAGYTFRSGKFTRMSQKERRNRRQGQRRGKVKRKAKMARTRINRAKSLRKLQNVGGRRK